MLGIKWMRGAGFGLVVLMMAVLASGCSPESAQEAPEADLGQLEQRVRDRWDTLIARDYGQTWEYSTPNYRRNFPKELFMRNFSYAVDWELTGIEVVTYDADAAVASVAVGVMSKPTKQTSAASIAIGAVPVTINEQWLFIDGEWWHSANL